MNLKPDSMPGPMTEIFSISSPRNYIPGGFIDLFSVDFGFDFFYRRRLGPTD